VGDIGMDEEVWKAPAEFRPERFLPGSEGGGTWTSPAARRSR